MNSIIRFSPGESWAYRGLALRFERELGAGTLHFMVERTLAPFQVNGLAPDAAWATKAFAEGELVRLSAAYSDRARAEAQAREYDAQTIAEMDPGARLRKFVVTGIDEMGGVQRGDLAISKALAGLWAKHPETSKEFEGKPSARTVRRWLDSRGAPGERDARQMLSMSGRVPRARRLPPAVLRALEEGVMRYWSTGPWSLADAYAVFAKHLLEINSQRKRDGQFLPSLPIPSRETFRLEVLKYECHETWRAKFGEKRANARFKPSGRGLRAQRFLQLGALDHTLLDGVAVIDADWLLPVGRPWLTVLMDVKTRCIVSFVLSYEPPSMYSFTECIKRANRPKSHLQARHPDYPVLANIFGRFDEIIVDNGRELVGLSAQDALADLGTSIRIAPVASPTYKAVVERFFVTLNNLLNTKLPGGVFRPELLREMGYDPTRDAVLTIAEIEDLIWEAIGFYHINIHSGVGAPPAQLWQREMALHGIDVIGDDSQLDKLLGAVKRDCTLTKSGLLLFNLVFHDPAKVGGLLDDLAGSEPKRGGRKGSATATVKVKYNPANFSEIHVWNRRRNRYVTLPCEDETYINGLSLWHHQKIQEWAKLAGYEFSTEEQRLIARAQLASRIRDAAPQLKLKQRRSLARLLASPTIASLAGSSVTLEHAPARHDGLAPVIKHDVLAQQREDGDILPLGIGPVPTKKALARRRKERPPARTSSRQDQASVGRNVIVPETGNYADFEEWSDEEQAEGGALGGIVQ